MKTSILKTLSLILFSSLFIAGSCSSDDEPSAQSTPFVSVNIDLTSGLNLDLDDTSFTQQGFNFNAYRAISVMGSSFNGVALAYSDNEGLSSITLDLSTLDGLSKITASIADQGGGTIELLNNGEVLETINVQINPLEFREFNFMVNNIEIDAFRYSSLEGFINYILLE